MPPRYLTFAIVAFWLGMTAWLAYRDLWPRWRSGEPPPYAIDLADEARRQSVPVPWTVYRRQPGVPKDEKVGRLHTWAEYRDADDSFELHGEMNNPQFGLLGLRIEKVESRYRVGRAGDLREIDVQIIGSLLDGKLKGEVRGEVRDRMFHARCRLESPLKILNQDVQLPPVPVSDSGAVINPLHPVNRIAGLRPGQAWRMPLVDPLADALAGMVGTPSGPRFLDARVADVPRTLVWQNRDVPCLVIEYQGDEVTAQTWVRQSDGLVLRQEAARPRTGEIIILQRE